MDASGHCWYCGLNAWSYGTFFCCESARHGVICTGCSGWKVNVVGRHPFCDQPQCIPIRTLLGRADSIRPPKPPRAPPLDLSPTAIEALVGRASSAEIMLALAIVDPDLVERFRARPTKETLTEIIDELEERRTCERPATEAMRALAAL